MENQIEKKACKNCIHYQMCLDSYREGVRQGENLDMSEEEYFADACGCNFYADERIYRKQSDTAKEIFVKLENLMLDGEIGGKYPAKVINPAKYAELKKKYTKGE